MKRLKRGVERNRSTLGILSAIMLFTVGGCEQDPATCEIDERIIERGDSVTIDNGRVDCRCTEDGILCIDAPDMALDRGDAGGADAEAATISDAGQTQDTAILMDVISSPDEDIDGPTMCPPMPPEGSCDGQHQPCTYGQSFECCGQRLPGRQTCRCADGSWSCEDHHTVCETMAMDNGCARQALVCARWHDMLADEEEGQWSGDVELCNPGDMSSDWRYRVALHLNGYRFMAGVPPVRFDETKNRQAQACALAVHAGMRLTHVLDEGAACYSEDAAEGAAKSNLDFTPAIQSLTRYMIDPGAQNMDRMRHRLWMLAPNLGPVGIGSTDHASCLHVVGGNEGSLRDPPWIAWPPPGPVPIDATRADTTGWTIHSNAINLSRATVSISVNGDPKRIEQRPLDSSGTAAWAIAFRPVGWEAEVGVRYRVRVDNVYGTNWEGPIEYTVEMMSCAPP